MAKGNNPNHPKKGSRITVDPIRDEKDIKSISKLLKDSPRDHLLFVMGVNNGLRAGDLLKLKVKDLRYLKAGETFLAIYNRLSNIGDIVQVGISIHPARQGHAHEFARGQHLFAALRVLAAKH